MAPANLLPPTAPPGWLDVTLPIRTGMVHWPDNLGVTVGHTLSMAAGAAANVTELHLSAHTGTHVDAPRHFIADGADVAALDLSTVMGPAVVVAIQDPHSIGLPELAALPLAAGDRVLFKTLNSAADWSMAPFNPDFVRLAAPAARHLREIGVVCVGVDYLSVGPADTHLVLLGAGITVIEGLALQHVEPGRYELLCLPLPIVGADGAPARVLLRPL
jgi:arylformamidase